MELPVGKIPDLDVKPHTYAHVALYSTTKACTTLPKSFLSGTDSVLSRVTRACLLSMLAVPSRVSVSDQVEEQNLGSHVRQNFVFLEDGRDYRSSGRDNAGCPPQFELRIRLPSENEQVRFRTEPVERQRHGQPLITFSGFGSSLVKTSIGKAARRYSGNFLPPCASVERRAPGCPSESLRLSS